MISNLRSDQRLPLLLALSALCVSIPAGAAEPETPNLPSALTRTVAFRTDVYPLLAARCLRCHEGADASSGVRLDLRAELLGETNGKPLVQAGKSADSRLIHLVAGLVPDMVMPQLGKRLTGAEVGLLRAWIDQGLPWEDALFAQAKPDKHWAFQAVSRPALPSVERVAWLRTPIDAFIAARQETLGLQPTPEAARRTLLRRLSLDLIGLPPTPAEMETYLHDTAADAYERVVERLLASPHYGERWGRHWLDVARWAESEGYESNHLRPYAWRYRDYVIQSFNQDKPYDRFLREQLAGDELLPYADANLIATGFLAAARLSSNEEDKALQRNDILVDIVNATSSALLGLTLNCAQCHNHKFDPISARDYYRFMGFFVKGQPANLALHDPDACAAYEAAKAPEYDAAKQLQEALLEGARRRLIADVSKTLSAEMIEALDLPPEQRTPAQANLADEADLLFQFTPNRIEKAIRDADRKLFDELKKKLETLEKSMPDRPQTFGFYSPATSPTRTAVLPMKGFYPLPYEPAYLAQARPRLAIGGDVHQRGPALDVGWPALFGPTPAGAAATHPRLALADWLTRPDHPLTARVWVNRLWQYHFGRGLVATPGDFGLKGAPPTHPELLDWLATELVRSGWSTKHLHRLIVCSSTYRQSAEQHAGNTRIDPENTAWWRWSPRRLEAEAIRDALLCASGELDPRLGGASVAADVEGPWRRSLYLLQKREQVPAQQALFDGPNAAAESCARRYVSTVPLQALYLLNNPFLLERARAFAGRVRARAGDERERQIHVAFALALGRTPEDVEIQAARRFFETHGADAPAEDGPDLGLVHFCLALLNLNEFVYLE